MGGKVKEGKGKEGKGKKGKGSERKGREVCALIFFLRLCFKGFFTPSLA